MKENNMYFDSEEMSSANMSSMNEENNDVKVISSRIETTEENECGSCGPYCSFCVVAETVLEVNGKKIYLTSGWIDEAPEEINEDITNESIFDTMLMKDDEVERLENLRCETVDCSGVCTREWFGKMEVQIIDKLKESEVDQDVINMLLGIETDEDYDEEDEEDEDEEEGEVEENEK